MAVSNRLCEQVRLALQARLDGQASCPDPWAVKAHLESCECCQGWLSEQELLQLWWSQRERLEAPAGLSEAVMARVRLEPPASALGRSGRGLVPGLTFTGALLLLAGLLLEVGPAAALAWEALMNGALALLQEPGLLWELTWSWSGWWEGSLSVSVAALALRPALSNGDGLVALGKMS